MTHQLETEETQSKSFEIYPVKDLIQKFMSQILSLAHLY